MLETHLNKYHPNLLIGTDDFYLYALNQLLWDTDEILAQHEHYSLIHAYLAEYKVSYDDYLLCIETQEVGSGKDTIHILNNIISTNDCVTIDSNTKAIRFDISEEFLSQTINDLLEKNRLLSVDSPAYRATHISGYSGIAAAEYALDRALVL